MDPEPLTEAELDLQTFIAMQKHGSPFFARLGYALGFADLEQMNAVRLAFPNQWATYRLTALQEYKTSGMEGGPVS